MRKLFLQVGIIAAFGGMVSCEKVIDVPLNEANQQIIIEGVGRNFLGESYVLLSRSGSVYDDSGFEKLSGATVTVTDKDGVVTVFEEEVAGEGKYVAPTFQALPNNKYTLSVNVEGKTLISTNKTNSLPVLDSLTYIPQYGGFGPGTEDDTTYLLFYNFVDLGSEVNYYRVRAWVNGERDDNFYIGDDALGNGQLVVAPLFATAIEPRDTVYVELLSMDEDAYEYLFTLSSNLTSGAFAATPANPVSNIEGDAIGYYGVYMVDTMSIIMP